jgi:hypothetical protein
MRDPIAVETGGAKHAYGVVVPDLPGCFSAGDTLDEALNSFERSIAIAAELGPSSILTQVNWETRPHGKTSPYRSAFFGR